MSATSGSWSLSRTLSRNSELTCTMSYWMPAVSDRCFVTMMWSSACELPSKSYVYRSFSGSSNSLRSYRMLPLSVSIGVENSKSFKSPSTITSAFESIARI